MVDELKAGPHRRRVEATNRSSRQLVAFNVLLQYVAGVDGLWGN